MDLLLDVMNIFNEPGGFVILYVSMRRFVLCGGKGKSYINGAQWLKSQAYLKRVVASRVVNSFVVVVLHIRKVFIHVWGCLELYIRKICMTIYFTTFV